MPNDQDGLARPLDQESTVDSDVLLRIGDGLGVPRPLLTDDQSVGAASQATSPAAPSGVVRLTGDAEASPLRGIEGFQRGTRVSWPFIGPPEIWSGDGIREACARRDVAQVFKLLNHAGVSQRRIAAAVGINQSEVCEILGGRHVQSVELLQRIADGLGCPRSWWGLAHDTTALGFAGDLARVTLAVSVQNAQQLALSVARLSSQVAALLDILGVPPNEPCLPS